MSPYGHFFCDVIKIPEKYNIEEYKRKVFQAIYVIGRREKSDYFWFKALNNINFDTKPCRFNFNKYEIQDDLVKRSMEIVEDVTKFFGLNKQEFFQVVFFELSENHSIYGLDKIN